MGYLVLSSADKTSGDINNFQIQLTNPIEKVRKMKVIYVSIPNTWYTIEDGYNDKIYFNDGSNDYTATLTSGKNYTFAELELEIQTQMNAAYTPDNNFSVSFDTATLKYTITHTTTTFKFTWATNTTDSARIQMGFSATDGTLALSQTSDLIATLVLGDSINIECTEVAQGYYRNVSNSSIVSSPTLKIVDINANFGSTISFENQTDNEFVMIYSYPISIQHMTIKLKFTGTNNLVPIKNDWRIVLRYNT